MRTLILIASLTFGLVSTAAADGRPEVSRYVKAYVGAEGVEVSVVRIGPLANQEALIKIKGIDHHWDQRIHRTKIEQMQRGKKYVATIDGKNYDVLVMDDRAIELYVPGLGRSTLTYDKPLSAQDKAEFLLTDYLNQK
jgi:hypothetical protein